MDVLSKIEHLKNTTEPKSEPTLKLISEHTLETISESESEPFFDRKITDFYSLRDLKNKFNEIVINQVPSLDIFFRTPLKYRDETENFKNPFFNNRYGSQIIILEQLKDIIKFIVIA